MSKLNVGQGFTYPDTTEQETAGVITDSATAYFYSLSGDNSLNGLSPEKSKATIQDAIDTANANPSAITTVNEAEGGIYTEAITLYDGVLFEGTQTAIITTGLIGISAASSLSFRPQAIITTTDNATLVEVDGVDQFGLDVRSITLSGASCTGFDVKGNNSGLFFTSSEIRVNNTGITVVKYTGMSDIPADFNFNTVILNGNNSTFFDFDSSVITDTVDVNISSLNSGPTSSLATGTCGFIVRSGVVKVRAGTIGATMAVEAEADGVASVSANVIGGNTYSAGIVIYDTVGVILGNLETTVTGGILWRGSTITGNATNAGSMSIKCDSFVGEIVNTGSMYAQIGDYTGVMPTDDGSINGVINGVHYGNWKQNTGSLGYVFTSWGANIQTIGRHPAINGTADGPEISSLGISASAQIPADGTIDVLTYYSDTGDNTTTFQIIKNGAVAHTFTCDAAYGRETGIDVSVAVGDNVGLRYSAGTKPASGIYSMYIS